MSDICTINLVWSEFKLIYWYSEVKCCVMMWTHTDGGHSLHPVSFNARQRSVWSSDPFPVYLKEFHTPPSKTHTLFHCTAKNTAVDLWLSLKSFYAFMEGLKLLQCVYNTYLNVFVVYYHIIFSYLCSFSHGWNKVLLTIKYNCNRNKKSRKPDQRLTLR